MRVCVCVCTEEAQKAVDALDGLRCRGHTLAVTLAEFEEPPALRGLCVCVCVFVCVCVCVCVCACVCVCVYV